MAIAVKSVATYAPKTSGNYTFSGAYFPSSIVAGDLLIWVGSVGTMTSIVDNLGATWTGHSAVSYYKFAVGGETSATITQTGTTHGVIILISGASAMNGGMQGTASTGTSVTTNGFWPANGTVMIFCYQKGVSTAGVTPNPLSGWATPVSYATVLANSSDGVSGDWTRGELTRTAAFTYSGSQSSGASSSAPTAPVLTTRQLFLFGVTEGTYSSSPPGGLAMLGVGR